MTPLAEFIARENIRRFKAQLLIEPVGQRKATIFELLETEEGHLRELLGGHERGADP